MSSRITRLFFLGALALAGIGRSVLAEDAAPAPLTIDQLKTRAEAGDVYSQLKLAQDYSLGQGVPMDNTQAAAWTLKAAKQGNVDAEFHLGYIYANGAGLAKDDAESFMWYLKAAGQGAALAQLAVGSDYFYGIGTAKDIPQSIIWLRKSAVQGNADAQMRLGVAYLTAKRSPEEIKKGFTYLLYRARGDGYAAYWIACCYQDGIYVSADPVKAYMWAQYASALKPGPDLNDFMAKLKAAMTTDQIHDGEQSFQNLPHFLNGEVQAPDLSCTFTNGTSNLIHFEWVINNILIPVQTKDQSTAYLMFDTGASGSLLSKDFADKQGLKGNTYLPLVGIGEDLALSTISDGISMSLPGMTFNNSRWGIVSDFQVDAELGKPVVGILGQDLTRYFVIRINYTNRTIEFIRRENFQPQDAPGICLPLTPKSGVEFVAGTVVNDQAEAQGTFMVDTGDNGAIDLFKFFQDQNPSLRLKGFAKGGSSGIGGLNYSSIGTCSNFYLGESSLPAPLMYFEQNNEGLGVGINGGKIGNEIWRRFDVVLDFPDQKIYLQKNAHFSDPYNHSGAGMHILASGPNYETLTVREVLPGSPASQAGFHMGDILVKMNELGDAPLIMGNVYPLMHKTGIYHLLVRRNDQNVSLVLELRNPYVPPAPGTQP